IVWDSRRGGRGRVVERVSAHEPGGGQVAEIEDPRLRGTQALTFRARDGGCEIAMELAYDLKEPGLRGAVADALFARRALRDAMTRTLRRFARELEADRELAS
ncbi:MAG: SRPBCC family protein, partial [Actinomycetota bacterium]|nr:SRPBCC family protein [Actinomycetota bacterium]